MNANGREDCNASVVAGAGEERIVETQDTNKETT